MKTYIVEYLLPVTCANVVHLILTASQRITRTADESRLRRSEYTTQWERQGREATTKKTPERHDDPEGQADRKLPTACHNQTISANDAFF